MSENAHRAAPGLDREMLADVLRCLPAGVIVVDEHGDIVLCNPRADVIRGVGARIGHPVADCHPERTQKALARLLERFRTQPPGEQHPIVVERGDRWEVSYSRVVGRDGRYRGAVWMAHDIGRQKELQRKLLHEQRLSGLGRMAARLAHDVKNPLNIVAGAVHNLRATARDDDAREMIAVIEGQVTRLQELVCHLREATRPLRPRMEGVDIVALVAEAARAARRGGGAAVRASAPERLPEITADPELLRRLLDNALDNAGRAAGPHGEVRIDVRLETREDGELLALAVEDDGPGFPDEVLEHLFEPFVTTHPDGTGLGLVIMREICLLHGGDLSVENLLPAGARVTARIRPR